MINPINFCKDLKTDILTAYNFYQRDDQNQNQRIASIALRIIGAASALFSAATFLAGVSVIGGSSYVALDLIAVTALRIILFRDLLKIGYNLRETLPEQQRTFQERLAEAAARTVQNQDNLVRAFRETWLYRPVLEAIFGPV